MLYRVVGFGHVKDRIVIKGARRHNLRDISVELPRNALIVFTGVSGSGKSSLAFDTILAEGGGVTSNRFPSTPDSFSASWTSPMSM